MLIRFRVSNYLSFNETREFSTLPGRVRTKKDHLIGNETPLLLKFSALYGANASGKSNLISALRLSQNIIRGSPLSGIARDYHRINKENKTLPTSFEYEIKIGTKCYAYGIDLILSESIITGEWLYEIAPGKDDTLIFQRQPQNKTKPFELGKNYEIPDLRTYASGIETNTDTLLLREMNTNKQDVYIKNPCLSPLSDVFHWIAHKLVITPAGQPLPSQPFYIRDDFDLKLANKLIPALGLGIREVIINPENVETIRNYTPASEFKNILELAQTQIKLTNQKTGKKPKSMNIMLQANRKFFILKIDTGTFEVSASSLQFIHDGSDTLFDLSEESEGTQRMMELIEILFAAYSGSDNVYIIDEIDRSLHPLLTHRLIELYLQLAKKGAMQLIVTTHESHLMDPNLLRRDEIWLINKNTAGASDIISLDEFNVQFDKKTSKAYMDGRYGAIPILGTSVTFENME